MSPRLALLALGLVPCVACITPSVVGEEDRAVVLDAADTAWVAATPADLPGTYVSVELTGPLAAALRMVVYLFQADGTYTGAGLVDGAPSRFQVIDGTWAMEADTLLLDGGAPATVEVAEDGSLRLTGDEGRVVLRREKDR